MAGSQSNAAWEMQIQCSDTTTLCIREIRISELEAATEVLAQSFHSQGGLFEWTYPLLRLGIQEELRLRLRSGEAYRLCLVAVRQTCAANTTSVQEQPDRTASQTSDNLPWYSRSVLEFNLMRNFGYPAQVSSISERELTQRPDTEVLVGTVELGLRSQILWQNLSGKQLYISNLAIAKSYRRQGVAYNLLQACEQAALAWGFHEIYLHVLESNLAARRLYRKLGYRLVRVECGIGHWLFGKPRQFLLYKAIARKDPPNNFRP